MALLYCVEPPDVYFMKSLSTYYDQTISLWLRSNPGRVVTTSQAEEIFGKATMSSAINGFKKCGIMAFLQKLILLLL